MTDHPPEGDPQAREALPPLPAARFSSWHVKDCKSLLNPEGIVNAFAHPPRVPEDPYWVAKGCHGEPLYTAEQMRDYARAAATSPAPADAPVRDADAKRLDYLQRTGSTIELLPGLRFRIGGLHAAVDADLRTALDAAMAQQEQPNA